MTTDERYHARTSLLVAPDEVSAPSHALSMHREGTAGARLGVAPLVELVLLATITVVACILRFYRLTSVPPGLHGDEAVAGIEGERILREGWIGPYSGLALGQPSGPLYLTAVAVRFLGHTVLAVRIVPAILGVLTVLALYVVVRRTFGATTALLAAAILATLNWHIHYARIGFPLEAWPLCVVLAAGALAEAIRRGSVGWWATAGALTALGLYSYNAHTFCLAIFGLFVAGYLAWALFRRPARALVGRLLGPLAMAIALVVVAWPMIGYARDPHNGYFNHAQAVSIFSKPEWEKLEGAGEQSRFLATRYTAVWGMICCHTITDGGDGAGVVALAPRWLLILAALGALLSLASYRRPLVFLGLLIVILIPVASAITVDGWARRSFAAAPFLAMFAAIPLGWLIDWLPAQSWPSVPRVARLVAQVAAVALIALPLGSGTARDYFGPFARSNEARWVFAGDLVEASDYLRTLPAGSYVYFLSGRWGIGHETLAYLNPDLNGEDRSKEYGWRTDLASARHQGTIAFVLLGDDTKRLEELQARYPQGVVINGAHDDRSSFVAYQVDLSAPVP